MRNHAPFLNHSPGHLIPSCPNVARSFLQELKGKRKRSLHLVAHTHECMILETENQIAPAHMLHRSIYRFSCSRSTSYRKSK